MKTLVLSFVLCLLFGLNYAQSTYYPLIDTGKTWHVLETHFPSTFLTFTYRCVGDTVINDQHFKILYRSNEEFPTSWTQRGFIREDENRKIYYSPCNFNDTIFQEPALVYDFNAKINDTIIITSFAYNFPVEVEIIISAVDSVLIDNEYRRKLYFRCENNDSNFWIEGIGSDNGLTDTGLNCYEGCTGMTLLCVKNNEEIIYNNVYYNDCYIVGVKDNVSINQVFLVYPNPTKNDIYITPLTNTGSDFVFVLYNLESEVIIQRKVINNNPLIIKTNNLKAGLYLYRIIDNDDLVQNGKIIIKK